MSKFGGRFVIQEMLSIRVNCSLVEVSVGHAWHSRHRHTGHRGHTRLSHTRSGHARRRSLSSDEERSGFLNLLSEFTVVGQEALSLVEGEVNEHTSDLGGKLRSLELSDEVEDGVTNRLLEMGVVSLARRNDLSSLLVVSLSSRVLRLDHHRLLHVVSSRQLNSVLLLHLLLSHLVHVLRHGASGVTTSLLVSMSLHLSHILLLSSSHLLKAIVALHGEGLQELSNLVVEFVSGGDVLPVVVLVVQLLELLETELILSLFILDLSELLELVMADLKLSLVEESVVAVLESLLGLVGSLEADESVSLLSLVDGEHLDALNLSILLEDTSEVLLSELRLEVLDVEVASLLGVLVLDGLTEELLLSLRGSEGRLDVELLAITHVSAIEGFNSFESLLRSILVVVLVLRHVADESKLAVSVVDLSKRSDSTKGAEEVSEVFVSEALRVVLDVEVVEHASDILSVFRVPLDSDALLVSGGLVHHFNGLGSIFRSLIADETIPSGGVVFVH